MLRTLFGLHGRVDRRTYLVTGVSLMLVKYAVDATVVYRFAHIAWADADRVVPTLP